MAGKILIIDDDRDITQIIRILLEGEGFETCTAYSGTRALASLDETVELIILDIMLPGEDGLSLCRRLRSTSSVPVIFLTALDSATDRVVGLELGADDYVVKPFDPRELLARIRTVLRRTSEVGQAPQSDLRTFAGWTLNVRSRELSRDDERITLSDALYRLLMVFLDAPFAVLSREYLLRQTQGRDADVFDRSVDIQVSRLRALLRDTGTTRIIKTVRGGGYMLSADVEHA